MRSSSQHVFLNLSSISSNSSKYLCIDDATTSVGVEEKVEILETEETAKPPPPPTFNRPYNYKPKQIKNNNEMVCQQYPHCT